MIDFVMQMVMVYAVTSATLYSLEGLTWLVVHHALTALTAWYVTKMG